MKKRPLLIWAVAIGLIASPLFYYFQHAIYWRIPVTEVWRNLSSVHPTKLVAMGLGPVVGILLLQVRPASWFAMLGYCLYTIGVNVYLHLYASMGTTQLIVFSTMGFAALAYFLRRSIYTPYFNPHIRVWVRDRIRFVLEVELDKHPPLSCSTFDISESGCFLVTEDAFVAGERYEMRIKLPEATHAVSGTVVWVSDGRKKPRGAGVKFNRTTPEFRVAVAQLRRQTR